ncbi:ABC transporter permease [Knoellia locipacati]|uniref:ABC transporter permease n=1 Tax=Knoellia locipacati TaxID=882824 RepID=UPI00384FA62C
MRTLLAAELLKLRSTRATALLALATLLLAVLTVATSVPGVIDENASLSLDDPDLLAIVVGTGFGAPLVLMSLLGVLAFTQEFRYGTITSTYLGEPRRTRVLVAKGLSLALASVVITTVTLAVTLTLTITLIRSQDGNVTFAAQFWQTVAGGFVVMAVYGVIGVAIGALVPNQIAAIVGVVIWMTVVEQMFIEILPEAGRWLPFAAASSLMELSASYGVQLLSVAMGGLVLLGYTASFVLLALRVTPRRDVL